MANQRTTIPRKGQDIQAAAIDATSISINGTDIAAVPFPGATKVANYTVTAADNGTHFIAGAANLVFSLPATVKGLVYRFSLAAAGLSVGTGLSISPVAADKIMGNGFTSADNKDAINTGASDREGDFIELTGDGVDGWYITGVIGTWAREA